VIDLEKMKKAWAELIEEDKEMKELFDHPFNALEVTDEML